MNKIGTFIFYGRSGSGKGTQAELLKKYLEKHDPGREVFYLQTGKEFRKFAQGDTHTHKLVKEVLDRGGLLPAFLPIWVWTGLFINSFRGVEHLIFDGLGRRVAEAPVLDGALKFYKREKPDVILLNVSREWATQCLKKRGRHDDTDEEIKKRLNWFDAYVAPTIKFFMNNPDYRFRDINGEQTIEKVHQDIIAKVF